MKDLHVTMENVVRLAEMIAEKHGVSMKDAMGLAEFNLRYASSFKEAAERV